MRKIQISASTMDVDTSFEIGQGSSIIAQTVRIGRGVIIGDKVSIVADEVILEDGVKIGSKVQLLSPVVQLRLSSQLSGDLEAEFNEYFRLGPYSTIGKNVVMVGQGFQSGEYLWMKENVIVGGGGARGPRSYLTIGDHTSVFDKCYINLSELVNIGSQSALSASVSLLTHAAWQPALMGFSTKFGSIEIGDYSVIYLNSSVMPGVKIGDYVTIGASSLVTTDVPNHCLATGVPAVIKKGPQGYPYPMTDQQKLELIYDIVVDYLTSLPHKGIDVVSDRVYESAFAEITVNGSVERIVVLNSSAAKGCQKKPLITLSLEEVPESFFGTTHFDLKNQKMHGEATSLAEDFRDYLRRRAIRVITGKPYKVLPQKNLSRLKEIRKKEHML